MRLQDLTGQESGIIIYSDGCVIVTNWSSCMEDDIPILDPLGIATIPWHHEEGKLDGVVKKHCDDISKLLPGKVWRNEDGDLETNMDIGADDNDDIPTLFAGMPGYDGPTSGTVYEINDGEMTVIAPDGWN